MEKRIYPQNCRTPYGEEPMTEADWDRYFECRKTQDVEMTNTEAVAIMQAHREEFLGDDCGIIATKKYKIPLKPNIAFAMKYTMGMRYLIEYNLSLAKKMYPDEF